MVRRQRKECQDPAMPYASDLVARAHGEEEVVVPGLTTLAIHNYRYPVHIEMPGRRVVVLVVTVRMEKMWSASKEQQHEAHYYYSVITRTSWKIGAWAYIYQVR